MTENTWLDTLNQFASEPIFHGVLLVLVGLWAGIQNALAGGGSFVTLPALMAAGLTPIEANITSTVALFPGQAVSGSIGYRNLGKERPGRLWSLIFISLLGGALGGLLLMGTPPRLFSILLPWLVLFATLLFAWGSFRKKSGPSRGAHGSKTLLLSQFLIAIYGGYFGGGIGFLMLAALSMAGFTTRAAGSLKNIFAAVMNLSAVSVFVTSSALSWTAALTLATGAVLGFATGSHLLGHINEKFLRAFVILIGLGLTVGLFLRQA
ncbi:MAG: hypothetical protein RLZ25_2427 [Pseudomonadota bacterium]|jgi:uncharacterized membrane protein YfcA